MAMTFGIVMVVMVAVAVMVMVMMMVVVVVVVVVNGVIAPAAIAIVDNSVTIIYCLFFNCHAYNYHLSLLLDYKM